MESRRYRTFILISCSDVHVGILLHILPPLPLKRLDVDLLPRHAFAPASCVLGLALGLALTVYVGLTLAVDAQRVWL